MIEHKLLTALNDEDKVAILATKQNLEDMLIALEGAVWNGRDVQLRCKDLAVGMRQLLREAFPPND